MSKITVASRMSNLAVYQSNMLIDYLKSRFPDEDISLLTMKTTGDVKLAGSLAKLGGKGLFVKELDEALRNKEATFTVHSLKDMPAEIESDIPLVAFSQREDPRDVLVLPEGKTEIDLSKPIGCSSLRRISQLSEIIPGAKFKVIRGNVETRLNKVDSGEYAATIFAMAGLRRLGLENRVSRVFSVDEMVPSAGQAIVVVQARQADTDKIALLDGFDDKTSRLQALGERAFVAALGGDCTSPVGIHFQLAGDIFQAKYCYGYALRDDNLYESCKTEEKYDEIDTQLNCNWKLFKGNDTCEIDEANIIRLAVELANKLKADLKKYEERNGL